VLMPLFEWMEAQAVYAGSPYIGPVVNLVHLLSMVLFMGAILIVDLRLLGLGVRTQSLAKLARDARPWLIAGLIGVTLTGIPQLMERATDQYETSTFWLKMYLLAFGVVWTFTVRQVAVRADQPRGAWPKVVAIVSIVVWASVASLARLIMLLPANTFESIVGS
jgi:hypothetical protein